MLRKRITITVVIIIVLLPLWLFLWWYTAPKKKLVAAIIDKTVLTPKGQEHISFTWVLNHEKYTKNKYDFYKVSRDYFGFFPRPKEQYRIKGLERFTAVQLDQLSNDADLVFITDSYGIYRNEWYVKKKAEERSPIIYGGLSQQDIVFLKDMKNKHKLILTEFNCIGSPSTENIRTQFEQIFSMKWTGWIGRYFETFDTSVNKELPEWLINNYRRTHNGAWPFKKSGVALVSDNDLVEILEEGKELTDDMPKIITSDTAVKYYGLPHQLYYPFWFDIVLPDSPVNNVISHFDIGLTDIGRKKMQQIGLPYTFPCVQMHKGIDYEFYYFAADFSDNPISFGSSYFKGDEFFNFFFYNKLDKADRNRFFWKYYRPLVTTIINDYYKRLNKQ